MRLIFLLLCFFSACFSLNAQSATATPGSDTFIDPRDGQSYQIITFNRVVGLGVSHSHTWMVENLRFKTETGSYYHEDVKTEAERQKYGRLYTWAAAQKACPEGWHLPTDVEWQRLIHQFTEGGLFGDGNKKVYQLLLEGGNSGFAALLGGNRKYEGEFSVLGQKGFYWSATEFNAVDALYYYFNEAKGKGYRFNSNKKNAFSCRCIKDD